MKERLDIFLVKQWFFESRNQAQEAILRWDITVNGEIVKKFSFKINGNENIQIKNSNFPRWYFKLQFIHNYIKENLKIDIFEKNSLNILDLGTSRWGFFMYAAQYANLIYGIEISTQFKENLKNLENSLNKKGIKCKIFFEDIFKFNFQNFDSIKFDIILADLTLEPLVSLKWISKFIEFLQSNWKIIWIHKGLTLNLNEISNYIYPLKILTYFKSKDRKEYYFLIEKEK